VDRVLLQVDILFCFAAFLLGSLPLSHWSEKLLQHKTSKMRRQILTLCLNIIKGVLPVALGASSWFAVWLGSQTGMSLEFSPAVLWAVGFFTLLGHSFCPWLGFRGELGLDVFFGFVLVVSPVAAVGGAIGFVLAYWNSRSVGFASLVGPGVAAATYLVFGTIGAHLWLGGAMLFLLFSRMQAEMDKVLLGSSAG